MPVFKTVRHCLIVSLATPFVFFSQQGFAQVAVPVSVAEIVTQPVYREVEITGSVTSPHVADLSMATAGLIESILVDDGDRVTRDQNLVLLDLSLARQQLDGAKAQLASERARLADAQRRLKEAEKVGSRGGIAETLVESIRTEVAQAEAGVGIAGASAAQQQTIVDRHTLKAPFAGVISKREADIGEWVTPGQAVLQLVATENLRLDFAMAEDFLSVVTPDVPVDFRLNATPGQSFRGTVKAIVPVADTSARTFLLRVIPETAIAKMMPGQSAVARIRLNTGVEAPVVPEDALLRYPNGRTVVWAVEQSGSEVIAREKLVSAGDSFGGMIAITSGLQSGSQVVVRGNESLQDGQRLIITSATGK